MRIKIPARQNVAETNLYVNIVSQDSKRFGQRPITFILPGGPGIDSSAYHAYSCLLDVTDLVFHDPRGCGLSDKGDPQTYNMENYINDLEFIRQTLNIPSIIVLGKSYGSMAALGYALRYEENIKCLILAAGAPSYRFLTTAKQNLKKHGTEEQNQICKKLWAGDFKNHEEELAFFKIMSSLYSKTTQAEVNDSYSLGKIKKFSIEAINIAFKTFLRTFDYEPYLHQIHCSTLILAAEDDWVNDVQHAKLMAEKIPFNQLKIFSNSGHSMEKDVPDEFFQTIRNFINNVG